MQPIIRHLFQSETLEEISQERLEAFVKEYPSFGIGHYLLSRKLRSVNTDGHFVGETRRTNLYFSNPFWLQWLLENGGAGERRETAILSVEELTPAPQEQLSVSVMELVAETEPAEDPIFSAHPISDEGSFQKEEAVVAELPVIEEEPSLLPENASSQAEAPIVEPYVAELPATEEKPPSVMEEASWQKEEPLQDAFVAELPVVEEESSLVLEKAAPLNEEPVPEPIRDEEPPFILEEELMQHQDSALEPIRDQEPPFVLEEPAETTGISDEEESEPMEDSLIQGSSIAATLDRAVLDAGMDLSGASITTQTPVGDGQIAFEPYHTIDYFASQGIKLSLDENPSDHLGKQLKSFTDWLKVMRRLPQKDRELVPDMAAERTIQTIAAHSIEGKEVVTEAMAEVLLKQGMRDKAREMYEKLSLLSPGKSAYFASKIEQLNSH